MNRPKVWITYAWADDLNDIDFVAQELEAMDITVRLDRWDNRAGQRLWDQIEGFIQDPDKSDAWLLYATQSSLISEACKEEYAYALDRALHTRGKIFPLIGLFPSRVDESLIPAGIRTRLYVSLTDSDWKERVTAGIEGRELELNRPKIPAFDLKIHQNGDLRVIEVRPRAGVWAPFVFAIPVTERDIVNPRAHRGTRGVLPRIAITGYLGEGTLASHPNYWYQMLVEEATPTQSYFIYCHKLPSSLIFGGAYDEQKHIVFQ